MFSRIHVCLLWYWSICIEQNRNKENRSVSTTDLEEMMLLCLKEEHGTHMRRIHGKNLPKCNCVNVTWTAALTYPSSMGSKPHPCWLFWKSSIQPMAS
jgi:hypothetical protein